MNLVIRTTAILTLAILSGCATTGDPNQGGLFGWSETKAKERQQERQTKVSAAESELAAENQQGEKLRGQAASTERNLASAQDHHDQADQELHRLHVRLADRAERLENLSPTPATASRARALKLKVNTIVAQLALPAEQRIARLQAVSEEIDAAYSSLSR